jgi:hypothetical protein
MLHRQVHDPSTSDRDLIAWVRVKFVLVAVVASLAAWLYVSGAYEAIDPERMRRWLQDAGAWGGVLFVAVYCCLQPLGVRSVFFLLSAPMVWDPVTAFFLSWAGIMGASLAAFGVQLNTWLEHHPVATWPWDRFGPLIILLAAAVIAAGFLMVRKWQDKLSFENRSRVTLSLEQES